MPTVTLTLTDTPSGVQITSDWRPAVGAPCSLARMHAQEIINRTQKIWSLPIRYVDQCAHACDSSPQPAQTTV